jgi:hypothetical protein
MLGRHGPGQYHFRLAGGFIADLHGRDLREENLMRIWRADDRTQIQLALESARRKPDPLVIEAEAQADFGGSLSLEIMLSPLAVPSGAVDRVLGFYQPTTPVAVLAGQPVGQLKLKTIRSTAGENGPALPRLRLAAVDGRQIAQDKPPLR